MKRLKNKVFFTVLAILTVCLLSFIAVFNVQDYMNQKSSIKNSLDVATGNVRNAEGGRNMGEAEEPPKKPEENIRDRSLMDENIIFMDSVIYTVLLDEGNNIKEVVNHSSNDLSDDEISSVAAEIIGAENKEKSHIGNLYFDDYSYEYLEGEALVILDNTAIKEELSAGIKSSLLIFLILELIILLISKVVTVWITRPVRESFERQKSFIADASHELKTPLSVIIASSEALEDYPDKTKWLKNIRTEADRMDMLITDLLDLAVSERKEEMPLQPGNLSKTVELSVLTFEGKAFESGVKLEYNIEENIKMNMAENSIKQLVEILLDNAVKHSEPNNTVYVELGKNNSVIELSVKNNGEPIPEGEEDKIFERFYRVDKSRSRREGRYGLGLAIARNIVERHNGRISAYSSSGSTVFKVEFKRSTRRLL